MKLNKTGAFWDRITRNEINENWEIIEGFAGSVGTGDDVREELERARQGENELVDNLIRIEKRITDVATEEDEKNSYIYNEIKNGDFSSVDLSDFLIALGTGEVVNGNLILTNTGGHDTLGGFCAQRLLPYVPTDQVWYIKARARVLDSNVSSLRLGFRGISGIRFTSISNPVDGQWYDLSYRLAPPYDTLTGEFRSSIQASYPSGTTVGKRIEVDYLLAVNLTKAFGAGKEPSQSFMDDLIDNKFGGYFNGSSGVGVIVKDNEQRIDKIENSLISVTDSDFNNKINNGTFEGTSYWEEDTGTTISAQNNQLIITGTGTNKNPRAYQDLSDDYLPNERYYVRAEFNVISSNCNAVGFAFYGNVATGGVQYERLLDVEQGKSYIFDAVFSTSESGSGKVRIQIRSEYLTEELAEGEEIGVKNVTVFNLTEIFGEGNEPSKEEFSKLLRHVKQPQRIKITDLQQAIFKYASSEKKATFNKEPLLAITFDDGYLTDFEIAYPLLKARGIRGTSFIWVERTGTFDRAMDWEQLHHLKNDGWGVECHTYSHPRLAELTDEEIDEQFKLVDENFIANDLPAPHHHAFPFGSQNADVRRIAMLYRKTARRINPVGSVPYNTYEDIDFSNLNARGSDIRDNNVSTRLPDLKHAIDETIDNNGILIFYSHEMKENAGDYETKPEYFEELIDYAVASGIKFVTMEELYNRVQVYRMLN